MKCPFCQKFGADLFDRDSFREFFLCASCTIIFVPRTSLPDPLEEKKRYDAHQNDESDPGYRQYLMKTVRPVISELKGIGLGLDFGCGKTQLLGKLFHDHGYAMDSYDLFYLPDESIWEKSYDFVVMNEVIEHLGDPMGTIERLKTICRGPLFVRTKFYPTSQKEFTNWFYKRDLTHVQFFNRNSLSVLGNVTELDEDLYRIDWK